MADYSWIGPLVGAGAQVATGIAGNAAAKEQEEKALALQREILQRLAGLQTPEFEDITAEQIQSQLGQVSSDPSLQAAQMSALSSLGQVERDGGLMLSDRAALNDLTNQTALADSRNRAALSDEFARRGQLGSGAQLAMSMQGQQQAANRNNQQGMQIAGMAQQRALQAMMQRGQMAGQMRGQDFSEKSQAAKARDEIARWNAEKRQGAVQANNANRQQQFGNNLSKITGAQPATNASSDMHNAGAANTRNMYAGIGQATYEGAKGVTQGWGTEDDDYSYNSKGQKKT